MISPAPAWLVSFELIPLDVPAYQFGVHRSNGNGDISSYINADMNTRFFYKQRFFFNSSSVLLNFFMN